MSVFQFPPINNDDVFEDFVCDLFNCIYKTNTFKRFGNKGHNQKGIDVFSSEFEIIIQCKKKDLNRKEIVIRKELLSDIENDLNSILTKNLKIKYQKIYFLSTYKNHPDIDEYCVVLSEEKKIEKKIFYWGWQTIENHINDCKTIIEKYFKSFIISENSNEAAIKRNIELKRRIKNDFSLWLDYRPEQRKRQSRMILRAIDNCQYPHENEPNEFGEYSWFAAEINRLYYDGIEFIYGIDLLKIDENFEWEIHNGEDVDENCRIVKVVRIGQISFSDLVEYDIAGDEHYICPHLYCKFKYKGLPFVNTYFKNLENNDLPLYFENDTRKK